LLVLRAFHIELYSGGLPSIGNSVWRRWGERSARTEARAVQSPRSFELVVRREADGPNAIWQADHTPLDIWLVRADGKTAKPWLTVVIDDYSRAVAGYFLSFEAPCQRSSSFPPLRSLKIPPR
jgi:transposase InsO family protein